MTTIGERGQISTFGRKRGQATFFWPKVTTITYLGGQEVKESGSRGEMGRGLTTLVRILSRPVDALHKPGCGSRKLNSFKDTERPNHP